MIENQATRQQLKLKENPERLVKLIETIKSDVVPLPGEPAALCSSYVMHAHLSADPEVIQVMQKNRAFFASILLLL